MFTLFPKSPDEEAYKAYGTVPKEVVPISIHSLV